MPLGVVHGWTVVVGRLIAKGSCFPTKCRNHKFLEKANKDAARGDYDGYFPRVVERESVDGVFEYPGGMAEGSFQISPSCCHRCKSMGFVLCCNL